ncbi:MAG: non-ribosomal peptide synthetase [Syntrophomonas sp.]
MNGAKANQAKDDWEIDLFRPEDAPGVVELYQAVYGNNYPVQEVYNPEYLINLHPEETYRIVGRTLGGEIVGHFALYRSSPPNKNLYESGQMMIRHDYRTSNIAFELAEYAIQKVPRIYGIESIWGEAVCNHILTQIMSMEQGFYETALEIDLMPGESFSRAFDEAQPDTGRISTLALFRIFKKKKQTIYLPPVYEKILKYIYEGADFEHVFLPGDAPLQQGIKTSGEIALFAEAGAARLTFHKLGGDFAEVLGDLEQKALAGGAVIIQAFFPLTEPAAGSAVDIMRQSGYFLGGALPQWFNDDGMLMQKAIQAPNFSGINLYSERSQKLLEFIKADWQDTSLSADEIVSQYFARGQAGSEERELLLHKFNDNYMPIPRDKVYIDLFIEQVGRTPDNIAVIDSRQRLTYSELNHLTDRLAAYLVDLGVKPDGIVGIMMPRTAGFMVGVLAIMKAGGAYLPISPDYPEGRIEHLVTDSNIRILLTNGKLAEKAAEFAGVVVDMDAPDLFSYRGKSTGTAGHPSDMAYIIYTSGSTGKPKGVMINNTGLVNLCCWHNRDFQTAAEDVSALYVNTSFDASIVSMFPYLIKGAAVYIIPEELLLDISGLNTKLIENKATIIALPTQFAETYMHSCENSLLKYMIVGGEKLKRFKPCKYQLVNEYGPTEFTVCSTYFGVKDNLNNIPIGKPVANSWAYVLDPNGSLQPIGVPGELCMAGLQLSRGYLNRPDLTAQKFVTNPYATGPENSLMYKTGDLVRWLPDGNLEYLGRIDEQVKIRGYRIELGEIEQVLLAHNKINEAVVSVFQDKAGASSLCAYYVSDEALDDEEIKQFISYHLPSYMVPGALIRIENIPLTPHGKVDKGALPLPAIQLEKGEMRPLNGLEEDIARVWRDVLGVHDFGVNDSFFNLGGTSLKAVSVITRLQQKYEVNINSLFEYPSLQEFARHVTLKKAI